MDCHNQCPISSSFINYSYKHEEILVVKLIHTYSFTNMSHLNYGIRSEDKTSMNIRKL